MPGGTVGTFLDESTLDALNALVEIENRPKSQVLGVALRAFLALSPGARRAMFTIDGMADEEERAFAMKTIGRAALLAYERVLDARQQSHTSVRSGNATIDSEEAIETEAVRLSRR